MTGKELIDVLRQCPETVRVMLRVGSSEAVDIEACPEDIVQADPAARVINGLVLIIPAG